MQWSPRNNKNETKKLNLEKESSKENGYATFLIFASKT